MTGTVSNIQILRAFAALAVTWRHMLMWFETDPGYGLLHVGRAGVDVFFVISGFIMFHTTQNNARTTAQFWTDRIIRITPLEVSMEGRIVAGASAHPGAVVETGRAADPTRRLLRVRLGSLPKAISVGYRDVDKGRGGGGIATSEVEATKGEHVALGTVLQVDPRRATCVVVGGKLVARAAEPPPPTEPLLGDP